MDKFIDRSEAGVILAKYLKEYANNPNVIILALPRGGVPVAFEIATALSVPLDVFIVRKIGLPGYKELAIGAIASGNTMYLNKSLIKELNLNRVSIQKVIDEEREELLRREHLYRGKKAIPNLKDKIVILVDDGIATGSTMRAAVDSIRKQEPTTIVIAVPVAAYSTCEELAPLVEKIVCPLKPIDFYAVGFWYEDFPQTSDKEVIDLIDKSHSTHSTHSASR